MASKMTPTGEPEPVDSELSSVEEQAEHPDHPAADSPSGASRGLTRHQVQARLVRIGRAIVRRLPAIAGVLLVALAGGILGAELAPSTSATIGPLQAQVRVIPSLQPGIHLLLPPAGQVDFDTHVAPVALEGEISRVDLEGARELIDSPAQVRALGVTAGEVLRGAAIRAALTTIGCSALGALGLSLLVYRWRWRRSVQVAITLVGALVVTGAMVGWTANPQRLAQPKFTGLLGQAPYIAGRVPSVVQRFETYRSGLSDIVRSVTALYATTGGLSDRSTTSNDDVMTILHVSDIHLNPLAFDLIDRLVTQFGVDAVLDSGDITTWGTEVESSAFSQIGKLKLPYIFVRGNHDSVATETAIKQFKNAIILDDQVVEVDGLVIAGIGDPVFTPDSDHPEVPASAVPGPVPGARGTIPPSLTSAGPTDLHRQSVTELADTIEEWDAAHPDKPVQIAAIHEPRELEPLFGLVPTVMAGHTHSRESRLDPSGTRILIEGSTGGAGITARGLLRLADGKPLPLAASLVHYSRRGPRAGQIVAIDAITVGGFGLTSVNLERTIIPPPDRPLKAPPATR